MFLKVYLDESHHTDGPVCSVAGFAGTQAAWDLFEPAWKAAIWPKPRLHLRELRWSKPHRVRGMLQRAGAVPDRCSLGRIASTVSRKDYLDFVAGTDLELALDPYIGCFSLCLKALLGQMGPDDRAHVFMEEQERYQQRIEFYYDEVFRKRRADERLVGITFLRKDEAVAFQAADYLAFHVAKRKIDPTSPKTILTGPIFGTFGVGWNMTRDEMRDLAAKIASDWKTIDERERESVARHRASTCGD